MNLLLDGDDPVLSALRAQRCAATVESVTFTGKGFYLQYRVPESEINLPRNLRFCFGDVEGYVQPLNIQIGFLLWVVDGALDFLEAYTYGEPWPEDLSEVELGYMVGARDLKRLRESFR